MLADYTDNLSASKAEHSDALQPRAEGSLGQGRQLRKGFVDPHGVGQHHEDLIRGKPGLVFFRFFQAIRTPAVGIHHENCIVQPDPVHIRAGGGMTEIN